MIVELIAVFQHPAIVDQSVINAILGRISTHGTMQPQHCHFALNLLLVSLVFQEPVAGRWCMLLAGFVVVR
jgi:type III secretory pathway component EscS